MGVPSQQSAGSAHHWHGIEVVVIRLRFLSGNTVLDNQRLEYEYVYKTSSSEAIRSSDGLGFIISSFCCTIKHAFPTMPICYGTPPPYLLFYALSSDVTASVFQLVPSFFNAVQMCQTHNRDHFARQHAQLLHQKLHSSN